MISERENQILRIIVEEYIKTAKPVSSSHICKNIKYFLMTPARIELALPP